MAKDDQALILRSNVDTNAEILYSILKSSLDVADWINSILETFFTELQKLCRWLNPNPCIPLYQKLTYLGFGMVYNTNLHSNPFT